MDELVLPRIDGHMTRGATDGIEDKNVSSLGGSGQNPLAYPDISPGTAGEFHAGGLPVYPAYKARAIEGACRFGAVDVWNTTIFVGGFYDLPANAVFASLGSSQGCKSQHQYKAYFAFHDYHDRAQGIPSQGNASKAATR
jgi:hypothetical protein